MDLGTKVQAPVWLPDIQNSAQLVEALLGNNDLSTSRAMLLSYPEFLGDKLMGLLKSRLDHFYQADLHQAQFVSQLMLEVAGITGEPRFQGEALRGLANSLRYGGHFRESLPYFVQASHIYWDAGLAVEWARTQIGHIPALTNLGRYGEALNLAERARTIFEEHHEPHRLATLLLNIAPIHSRLGRDQLALASLEQAREIYIGLGPDFALMACWADLNRSIVLRNIGDYQNSLIACDAACTVPKRLGHHLTLARIDLSRAFTLFYLGRCNEALRLFDRARETFISLGNRRDAALIELYITDCLLQLNRYEEVVTRCDQIRQEFANLGANYEMAHSLANQGIAAAYLQRMDQAIAALVEARHLFAQDQLEVWIGICDLYLARLHGLQGDAMLSRDRALAASEGFKSAGLTPNQADADLVAAWALANLGMTTDAETRATTALASAQICDLPWVTYRGHHLLGHLARRAGQPVQAEMQLKAAIADLESLRHSLMVEFRPDFLLGRESVYQELVELYLDQGQVSLAWSLAERGKSRALLDLLDQEIDLLPRRVPPEDLPLVSEFQRLKTEHAFFARRWNRREEPDEDRAIVGQDRTALRQEMLQREKRMMEILQQLQIRNAGYAEQQAFLDEEMITTPGAVPGTQDQAEWLSDWLQPSTGNQEPANLVAYYALGDELLAFVLSQGEFYVFRRLASLEQIRRTLGLLRANMQTAARQLSLSTGPLLQNAQRLLHTLYDHLIRPLEPVLAKHPGLVVVPHGPLHYLPFQALHDGQKYLSERWSLSYLPNAGLMRHLQRPRRGVGAMVLGHSNEGRLPATLAEARHISDMLGGAPYLESNATVANLQAHAGNVAIIHVAAHGLFRGDAPLFSHIQLDDAALHLIDIYGLELDAHLVTLSACESGSGALAGGDELVGLSRGFFYAGAASLLLTLWTVEDQATANLMHRFYQGIRQGLSREVALAAAQTEVRQHPAYTHPYFWAPFSLIGQRGPLPV